MADVDWAYGTMVVPPTPAEPVGEGIAELLDAAEDIVNSIAPSVLAEIQAEDAKRAKGWKRFIPGRKPKR